MKNLIPDLNQNILLSFCGYRLDDLWLYLKKTLFECKILTIKKPERQRSMVEQLLTEFNLQHLRNINANLLSGGEVRRLQIARTLINNPKVILLDEPMAALDPIVVQDIQKYILKLQSYGTGVIVTDHNIQNLLQVVDKCVVIGEQTIIAEGKPKEILQSAKARELYFGSYE